MDGHDEMVVRRTLKEACFKDEYITRLLHGPSSRDAFIEKAAIAVMQGYMSNLEGWFGPQSAEACINAASLLWDALQASKETK